MSKAIFPFIPAHKNPGVYKITDETDGRVYIGSSKNVHARLKQHEAQFNAGRQSADLQAAFEAGHTFSCELLEALTGDNCMLELHSMERRHIYEYDAFNSGFNKRRPTAIPNNFCIESPRLSVKYELAERFDALRITSPINMLPIKPLDYSTPWDQMDGEKRMKCEVWIPEEIADKLIDKLLDDRISLDKFISDCIFSYLNRAEENNSNKPVFLEAENAMDQKTENRRKQKNNWQAEIQATLACKVGKDIGDAFREYAKIHGTTVSALLSKFVKDTLDAAGMLPDPKAPADPVQDDDTEDQ